MRRLEGQPPDIHCRVCGERLQLLRSERKRVGGIFGNWQWSTSVLCPGCGTTSGSSWATFGVAHPSRGFRAWLGRLLRRESPHFRRRRFGRRGFPIPQRPFLDGEGHLDIARLVRAAPFPVYGIKGQPSGLRLRSPGMSGDSADNITGLSLGYVRGPAREPEGALELVQGRSSGHSLESECLLAMVRGLLSNYGPQEQHRGWMERGDFHANWNLQSIDTVPRERLAVQVDGQVVEVEMVSWEEELLTIVHLGLQGHGTRAGSVGLSQGELFQALEGLVDLQRDPDALEEHCAAFEATSAEMRRAHPA